MEECEICGSYKELVDAVFEARPTQVCKVCAQMNTVVVLEGPSIDKIKNVERVFSVRERLEEAAKVREIQRQRMAEAEQRDAKTAFPESISYKVRKEREKARLSKEKLSDDIGLSVEEISKIEAGEKPSEKALKRYEQFFKKKFGIPEEAEGREESESKSIEEEKENIVSEGKGPLKDLISRARTFFTRSKIEEKEVQEEEAGERENKDEIQIY